MDQKQLKEKYMDIIRAEVWPGSESMQKYAEKETTYITELANGDIYAYKKPSIKKDFCFGYGIYGMCSKEEMNGAERMREKAENDKKYFIDKNLEDINQRISNLENVLYGKYEAYKYGSYTGQPHGTKLKTYSVVSEWDNPENDPGRWVKLIDVEKLTNDEIAELIKGWNVVKEMYIKRLNTYLKRYGLSKVNAWTYLRD